MSAMVYENGVYKEAETPKAWNGSAFVDTDGYYWDNGVQKEGWSGKYYLIKNGRDVVAGGEIYTTHGGGTVSYGTDYATFTPDPNDTDAGIGFKLLNIKNPKSYTKICIEYSDATTTQPNGNQWNGVGFYSSTLQENYVTLLPPISTQKTTWKKEITDNNVLSALTTGYGMIIGKLYWCGTVTIYNVWFE